MNNIVIFIRMSNSGGEGKRLKRPRVTRACERNGKYETNGIRSDANGDMKNRSSNTVNMKCGCLFLLKGINIGGRDNWKLEAVCEISNHAASEYLGHSLHFMNRRMPCWWTCLSAHLAFAYLDDN